MASAGRILIIPKGNYNAETEYEMLDLVSHSGASWLAKKIAKGIEPSDANAEYWFKMCEGSNTTELEQRIAAIENQLLSVANLDDIDLSAYATKAEVKEVSDAVDTLEINVGDMGETVNGLSDEFENVKNTVSGIQSANENFGKRNVLDHENAITRYMFPFTCPSAGEILVYAKHSSSVSTPGYFKVKRNGIYIATVLVDYIEEAVTTFLVAEGDEITSGGAVNVDDTSITFTPYKYQ